MAVQEQTPYTEYVANGITTSFALEFDCDNQNHLIVLVDDVEPVVGAWSFSNGAVVFNAAPENGKKITIQRNTPFSRSTDYQSYNNSFRPPSVNKDFDWIWLKLQELGVADWLLRLYIDRLHGEQKTYIDQKDTQLQNNINSLSTHVDQQDAQLQQNIDNLKIYVDDKDNELRAYLMEEIRKQGVALDQLDEYYNYLMQRLAQIAVDKGWDASFVVDGTQTQKEINDISKSVLNISALKSLSGVKNGDTVRTLGHTELGLGGGTYRFEALSSKTDNTGSYIASTVAAGTWVLISDLYFENFGVTTANADQSAKINACLEYAVSNNINTVSFEKPNKYFYDNYIIVRPVKKTESSYRTNFVQEFNIYFNGAKLLPLTTATNSGFAVARDNVTLHNFNAYGNYVKQSGKIACIGCALHIGIPVAADSYSATDYWKSAQFIRLINPTISNYKYGIKFHVSWNIYYPVIINSNLQSVYYGYSTISDVNTGTNQLTRALWLSPKHVNGACTFMLDNAETCRTFAGGSEFIYYEDIDSLLPNNDPVVIYTGEGGTSGGITKTITSFCKFEGLDIEGSYIATYLDGIFNAWSGRFVGRRDKTGATINIDATYQKGKINSGSFPERMGNQFDTFLGAESIGGRAAYFYLKSSTEKYGSSVSMLKAMMIATLDQNGLSFGLRGAGLIAKPTFNLESSFDRLQVAKIGASGGVDFVGAGGGANTFYLKLQGGIYNPVIKAYDPTGADSGSSITFQASALKVNTSVLQPTTDASTTLGTASFRFGTIYSSSGTISTSDERLKQQFRSQTEAEQAAALEIKNSIGLFKFNDAVEQKGGGARWHCGIKAQQVVSILESHGLPWQQYGFICYDEWPEQDEIIDNETGEIKQAYQPAGDRYAVRYDELAMFILLAI